MAVSAEDRQKAYSELMAGRIPSVSAATRNELLSGLTEADINKLPTSVRGKVKSAWTTNQSGDAEIAAAADAVTQIAPTSLPDDVVKPMYSSLRDEVLQDHPALKTGGSVDSLLAKASAVTEDMLAGKLPSDVQKEIMRISAEKSAKAGTGATSGMSRNLVARDLGLTSLQMTQAGLEAAPTIAQSMQQLSLDRLNFLQQVRQLDLSAAELQEQTRRFDVEERRNRLTLLLSAVSDYHTRAYGYASIKRTDQTTLDKLQSDYKALVTQLRGLGGR